MLGLCFYYSVTLDLFLMVLDEYFLMINLLRSGWYRARRQNFLLNSAGRTDRRNCLVQWAWASMGRGGGGVEGERWPPVWGISWNMAERPHACTVRLCLLYARARACVFLLLLRFNRKLLSFHPSNPHLCFPTISPFFPSTQVWLRKIEPIFLITDQ